MVCSADNSANKYTWLAGVLRVPLPLLESCVIICLHQIPTLPRRQSSKKKKRGREAGKSTNKLRGIFSCMGGWCVCGKKVCCYLLVSCVSYD